MPLVKQSVQYNFRQGLDLKTDPYQVPMGNFLELNNMVFTTGDRLTKMNGFGTLATFSEDATFLTTFNENLTAIGSSIEAYASGTGEIINKGTLHPLTLDVLPLIRSNTSQSQVDTAISSNGLVCTVYTDQSLSNLNNKRYMYSVADAVTGQNIIGPAVIPVSSGTVTGSPRVFFLDPYFVIVFTNVITATSHLQYVAISSKNTSMITANADIAAAYTSATTLSWDGVVVGNHLYVGYNTTSGGQSIKITYLTSTLTVVTPVTYSNLGKVTATIMSMTADTSGSSPIIYAAYYDLVTTEGYVVAVDQNLNKIISTPAQFITSETVLNVTCVATSGVLTNYYEVSNNYSYDSTIPTHYLKKVTVLQSGTVGTPSTFARSVGLASKAFYVDDTAYLLASYQSTYQPSYFLLNSSGQVVSRIAYSNGGGYLTTGLPSVSVSGSVASLGYLFKDFITSQNTSDTESISKSNIYSQTGINLVDFTIGTSNVVPAEIAQSLHLSGGFLWQYDGYQAVESNFFLWPDSVEGTTHNTGGSMLAQEYQYQAVYTWTDNQGNIQRSAPSIPVIVDMSTDNKAFTQPTPKTPTADLAAGSAVLSSVSSFTGIAVGQIVTDTTHAAYIQTGSYIVSFNSGAGTITLSLPVTTTATGDTLNIATLCSVTVNVPTLRLTYKITNPVKIEIFRWSTAQQEFFQVTSILTPLLNDVTADSVAFTDTYADNQILGNSLIYTTGGVLENIGAPSFNSITLFDDRLWGIDAEDDNLLWNSKQVIESTPVEMSDLLTTYVAPSIASQGSTGGMKCVSPMDDKLIIFKANALYYINGTGPDNTGANSQYSQPIFITSVVGSSNQQSIVFIPDGLMFQSETAISENRTVTNGIWLLSRGMEVAFIGAPVEGATNQGRVTSAQTIPGTTMVRFTLDSGTNLVYDYFYKQWGTFSGITAVSSTLYQNLHCLLDSSGNVFQETPGSYLNGTHPVLMKFKTSWINVAGLQGYQRAYFFYLLGTYLTPHFLYVSIAYDYNSSSLQTSTITPSNYSPPYGGDGSDSQSPYGQQSPYGGPGDVEQWRIFLANQRCQAFQVTVEEFYDPSLGIAPGAGLYISGLNLLVSMARSFRSIPAAQTVGGGTNGRVS